MRATGVKHCYEPIEHAAFAGIAAWNERIPRAHPATTQPFIDLYQPPDTIEEVQLVW